MNPLLVNILTFAAVFLAVFAANAVLVEITTDEKKRLRQRLDAQIREQQKKRVRQEISSQDLGKLAAEVRAELGETRHWTHRFKFMLDQSGLDWDLKKLVLLSVAFSLPAAVVGLVLGRSFLVAVMAAGAGGILPLLYVELKRRTRLERLRQQLPDAFDLMSRVMRAGQTISQAMYAVGEEFSSPVSLEFLYCYEQMNLGLSAEAALRELGRRTGLLEVKIFVLAVIVHRQTGGNLAELLDNLSHVVRERFRIRGMIKSLTAQGRFQAMILLSLPFFMFVLLMVIKPEYEMLLFQIPMAIFAGLFTMALGALWINRIVNFDY